jgi:hypothetical protein
MRRKKKRILTKKRRLSSKRQSLQNLKSNKKSKLLPLNYKSKYELDYGRQQKMMRNLF